MNKTSLNATYHFILLCDKNNLNFVHWIRSTIFLTTKQKDGKTVVFALQGNEDDAMNELLAEMDLEEGVDYGKI